MNSRNPLILFYSHDGFGLGHLSRTIYLAQQVRALAPEADLTIVTSSPAAHRMTALVDFAHVKLPSLTKTGVESYRPHRLNVGLKKIIALRSDLLLSTVQHLQPHVVVVDHRPLGLKGEARAALEWLRRRTPETRIVAGLRDVVDEPQVVRREWHAQGVYDGLADLYDSILVYGDRSVLDVTRLYDMPESVQRKVQFTGYLGRDVARGVRDRIRSKLDLGRERLVVVHAGGGQDGGALISAYLQCIDALPSDVHSFVITGPLMERDQYCRMHRLSSTSRVTLVQYEEDLPCYIAAADLSISMGGYNTVCEILSAGVRALIVPRIFPRKEQYIRAQSLAMRGLVQLLSPVGLTPDVLGSRIQLLLAAPSPVAQPVALDGGARAAEHLTSLLHRGFNSGWHTRSGRNNMRELDE